VKSKNSKEIETSQQPKIIKTIQILARGERSKLICDDHCELYRRREQPINSTEYECDGKGMNKCTNVQNVNVIKGEQVYQIVERQDIEFQILNAIRSANQCRIGYFYSGEILFIPLSFGR
jgi:hypothetical protein